MQHIVGFTNPNTVEWFSIQPYRPCCDRDRDDWTITGSTQPLSHADSDQHDARRYRQRNERCRVCLDAYG